MNWAICVCWTCGIFFHIAQGGEIIEDFAFGARVGDAESSRPSFQGADLLEGEGVALDGGGACALRERESLLEGGNPGQIDHGRFESAGAGAAICCTSEAGAG